MNPRRRSRSGDTMKKHMKRNMVGFLPKVKTRMIWPMVNNQVGLKMRRGQQRLVFLVARYVWDLWKIFTDISIDSNSRCLDTVSPASQTSKINGKNSQDHKTHQQCSSASHASYYTTSAFKHHLRSLTGNCFEAITTSASPNSATRGIQRTGARNMSRSRRKGIGRLFSTNEKNAQRICPLL